MVSLTDLRSPGLAFSHAKNLASSGPVSLISALSVSLATSSSPMESFGLMCSTCRVLTLKRRLQYSVFVPSSFSLMGPSVIAALPNYSCLARSLMVTPCLPLLMKLRACLKVANAV